MFDKLSYEDFCEIKDTEFKIADTDEDIRITLFKISEKKETPQNVAFSLYLKSPPNVFLEQKIYNLSHEKLGEGSLFIVPIEKGGDGFVYEAVFNRFIES